MKHIVASIAALAALLLGLLVGACFLLQGAVEDMTRDALSSAAGAGETTIESVEFSPLTREIVVRGWRSRRLPPDPPLSFRADAVRAVMTVRGLLSCLPVAGDLLNDADTLVPVWTGVRVSNVSWSGAGSHGSADAVSVGRASLLYPVLKQHSQGLRPPYGQAMSGIAVDLLEASGCSLSLHGAGDDPTLKAATFRVEGLRDLCAKSASATGVSLSRASDPGHPTTCESLTLEDIAVSPALLGELAAFASSRTEKALSQLAEAAAANGPIVNTTTLAGVAGHDPGAPFRMESFRLTWKEDLDLSFEGAVRGLSFPASNLSDLPLDLSGIRTVEAEADFASTGVQEVLQSGLLRLKGIGDFGFAWRILPARGVFGDARITVRDHGLVARLARSVSPDAAAAAMILKSAAGTLCGSDEGEAKLACARLGEFVDAPGTLVLATRTGRELSLLDLLAVSRRFGSLFSVETEQGPRSLSAQMDALFGRGAGR